MGGLQTIMIIGLQLFMMGGAMFGGGILLIRSAGALGNVFGFANDKARGFFDRNRNYRANKRKEFGEKAAQNERFGGSLLGSKKLADWGNSFGRQAKYAPTALKGAKNPLRPIESIRRYRGNQRGNLENLQKQRTEEASQDKEFSVLLDWDNAAAAFAEMLAKGVTDRKGMVDAINNDRLGRFNGMSQQDKNVLVAQMQGFREKYGDDRVVGMAAVKAAAVGGATDYTNAEEIGKFMTLGAHFAGDSGALKANYDANIAGWLTAGGRAADMAGGSYSDRAGRSGEAQTLIDNVSMQDLFARRDLNETAEQRQARDAAAAEAARLGGGVMTDTLLHQDPRLMADSKTKPYAMDNAMQQAAHLIENVDGMIEEQRRIAANATAGSAKQRNAEREIAKLERARDGGVTSVVAKLDTVNKLYANANITTSIDAGLDRPAGPVRAPAPGAEGPVALPPTLQERARQAQPEMYRYRSDPNNPLSIDEQQRLAREQAERERAA